MYTVYRHTNKLNGKKYVGITKRKPEYRWNNGEGYRGCTHFYNAIQKYGWEEFSHEILFTGLTKEEAEKKEKELIAKWDLTNDTVGYNCASGGNLGKTMSDETKLKIRNALLGRKITHSQETRVKISNSLKGQKLSDSTKLKMSNARKGRPIKEETKTILRKTSPKNKRVFQYDVYGKFIGDYYSMKEASRVTGINYNGISQCCLNKQKSAGGFIWKLEGD